MDTAVRFITGATSGMGCYVAEHLAALGGTLCIHGRNAQRLKGMADRLSEQFPGTVIETYQADFSSLQQVAQMADQVLTRHNRLDLLINNAGIGFGRSGARREQSKEGYELRFAVNYLAPYLLTTKLLPALQHTDGSRIVNVASIGQTPLDFSDLMLDKGYDGIRAYCQSKLALIMATFDWAKMLQGKVTVNALHPATYVDTGMTREAGVTPLATVADGGDSILWLATSQAVAHTNGAFFNRRQQARADGQAYDNTARGLLYAATEQMILAYL